MPHIADRNLYLDAAGNVVEEDDPAQATLLAAKGATVPDHLVKKHGLAKAQEPAEDKAQEPAEDKAQEPAEDKAVKGPQAKKGKG